MRVPLFASLLALAAAGASRAQPLTLEYRARYICQQGEPDHLMAVAALSGSRALVAGNRGLALIDLNALPVQGTRAYLDRLRGPNARDVYVTPDEKYVFVNTHRGENQGTLGFEVVKLVGNTLQAVAKYAEPNVLYEKMCIQGGYLYVAAHSYGLRIFDIRNREQPVLVGRLDRGFVDAFAVAVDGSTAYVADGAGGLKIVDVTSKTRPRIVAGETRQTARGTYEDVTVRNGRVYAAAGGLPGLAVYQAGKLGSRTFHAVPGFAESLGWIGNELVVGHMYGVTVFRVGPGTVVTRLASENIHRREALARVRLNWGVSASGNRLLAANWNYMDVYELKPAAWSTPPDIDCDVERLRFPPAGGTRRATVANHGAGMLQISSVTSSSPDFTVSYPGGTLRPGQSVTFEITYRGGSVAQGAGVLLLHSNDPDENPLPIQVLGNTALLDPGEPSVDFTLQTLVPDPKTGKPVAGAPFTLSKQLGKAVWFSIYGTW